jgi:hypothetical protein
MLALESQDTRAMQVETTDFLVDLADVNRTKTRSSHCSTTEGYVLVKVEQFAFTANNMTYALIGGATGWYWDFFPAPRGWGRIPVWGFGKVVASEIRNVEIGEELFGYFPMSTHALLKPGKIRSDGLHDASEHRAHLSPAYNYYVRTLANPAFDFRSKREIVLLRPLFFASFLVHDLLAERVSADADAIAITSASSKTAVGLAHLLSTRKISNCHIVGLTSKRNLDFARGIGVYDRVVAYDDAEILTSGSTAVVDFSGNSALIRKLLDALGKQVVFLCLVGYTHWDRRSLDIVEDTKLRRFFAPDQIRKRAREWGAGEFDRRYNEALKAYIRHSRGWLHIVEGFGPKKVAEVFERVSRNQVRPDEGNVLSLHGES